LPKSRPTRFPGDNQRPGSPIFLRHPIASRLAVGRFASRRKQPLSNHELARAFMCRYWNINQLCIDYAFRPRLSSRLTLGGRTFPRNPWIFGGGDSHSSFATHANIRTRPRSTAGLSRRFTAEIDAPLPHRLTSASATSALDLSPVTLSAQDHSTSELLRTL
jgi:hypothetical protein